MTSPGPKSPRLCLACLALAVVGCDGSALFSARTAGSTPTPNGEAPSISTASPAGGETYDSSSSGQCSAAGFKPPVSQLRRLSPESQLNTVRDLLNDKDAAPQYAPPVG